MNIPVLLVSTLAVFVRLELKFSTSCHIGMCVDMVEKFVAYHLL